MLTTEENDLLTQTGPETPMGQYFRRFWQPVLLSEELPEPDGDPVQVSVLGEELVAFRDTEGKSDWSNRSAPIAVQLFFGRNGNAVFAAFITVGSSTLWRRSITECAARGAAS